MSSRPVTPMYARRRSSIDVSFDGSPLNRNFSLGSSYSPVTPRSSHGVNGFGSSTNGFSGFVSDSNGLGNLADELAEAWDEDEGLEEGPSELQDRGSENVLQGPGEEGHAFLRSTRDSGIDVASSPAASPPKPAALSPSVDTAQQRHRRKQSKYKVVEEEDSDLELRATLQELETQLAAVDSLARSGVDQVDGASEDVVTRVIDELKDLGGQSGIETGASRLITAHTALTSALAHQTRSLQSLSASFLSPLSQPPEPDEIEELLPLITSSIALIPKPSNRALSSMIQLSNTSRELIHTLNYLADSLQMSRQTTNTAARRLRSATELVAELEKEREASDIAVMWIEQGKWQTRLADRDCARVCRDTVLEIEEVYQGWKEKLLATAAVTAA